MANTSKSNPSNASIPDLIQWISTFVASAVGIFYAVGYFSHVAHYNLLIGTRYPQGPQEYIRFAGDALITVLLNTSTLLSNPRLFVPMFWTVLEEEMLLLSTIFCFLALITYCLRKKKHPKYSTLSIYSTLFFILIAYIAIVRFEIEIYQIRNVLQPFKQDKITQIQQADATLYNTLEMRIKITNLLLKNQNNLSNDISPRWKEFYRPDLNDNEYQQRWNIFSGSFYLIITILVFLLIIIKSVPKNRDYFFIPILLKIIAVVVTLSQVMMFAILYGTIGCGFNYPVVSLRLDNKENKLSHPVYLIADNEIEILIYDRLDFFKIKHIPKTRLQEIVQYFNASPFRNCSYDSNKFSPCEARASTTQEIGDL